ncbi:hypothetical protein JTB14_024326 [Gonioctena quinquepunctata]|nr:hypothetical protein JTB14_024326 [Gonioctena quinquepunctata]
MSDLSHTNEELQTKLKSQVEELTKKDDDLGELKEINKDIVSSIKLQKKNNEDYIRELLRQIETEKEANIKLNEDITELNLLSRKMVSTIATLEAEYNECVQSAKLFRMELEKREQISLKIEEKGIVDIHGSETKPNKIIFIAGSHGRHLWKSDFFIITTNINFRDVMDILALTNSAINFILYCTMSRQFRTTFQEVFKLNYLLRFNPLSQYNNGTERTTEKTQISAV